MFWLLIIPFIPYFFLLLYIFRGLLSSIQPKAESSSDLPVSIIIACKNEEESLPLLLHDLSAQNYPSGLFEVIVVDDESEDNTLSVADSFKGISGIKVLGSAGPGKKSAIRTGILAASGDLIITTDADCRLNHGWISSMASFYVRYKPDLIIGPVQFTEVSGFFHRFQELEFLSLQGITAGTAALGHPTMCNGANLAFNSGIYKRHSTGLHDDIPSGDDIFLMQRIHAEKGSILWIDDQDAIVETEPSSSMKQFLRQRARWLSKSGAYEDNFTIFLAVVTLAVNLDLSALLIFSIFLPHLFTVCLVAFILKSVADLLILTEITRRYKKRNLLWWFIPAQVIYPFYVITVSVYSLFRKNQW
jgi:cellulose synthase/poly-beta-1,6-N-acetylglucosamine synthase-like glycosyltransferase